MALTVNVDVPLSDRDILESWVRSSTMQAALVLRARIVLLASEGLGTGAIVARTGVSKPTVILWKRRYSEGGIGALADITRPGRPKELNDMEIVLATLEPPP